MGRGESSRPSPRDRNSPQSGPLQQPIPGRPPPQPLPDSHRHPGGSGRASVSTRRRGPVARGDKGSRGIPPAPPGSGRLLEFLAVPAPRRFQSARESGARRAPMGRSSNFHWAGQGGRGAPSSSPHSKGSHWIESFTDRQPRRSKPRSSRTG